MWQVVGFRGVARRTRSRRTRASLMALGVVCAVGAPSFVGAAPTPAERAAQEIQEARDRADAAAQALFDTEAEIDRLTIEIAETEERLAEIEAEADSLRDGLEQQAVRSFVGAGGPTMPLAIDVTRSNDVLVAEVYSSIATENVHTDLDDFDAVLVEVDETRAELVDQQGDASAATQTYEALIVQAEAEVIRLGEIEQQRLQDEAVRRALEAEQRARAEREQAEQERRQRDAAAAAAAAARSAGVPAPSTGGSSGGSSDSSQGSSSNDSSSAPSAESAASNDAATESAPEAAPAQVTPQVEAPPAAPGLACPVAGPRAFADTWGAARSGGRRHQGVDVISPSGTPLVAMESGRIEFRSNGLGGKTLRLYGNSGTRYYYAHLSRYEGGNRSVNAGDVVGYVGRTGNTTTNHLHLQIHPNGGQPVNPYPATKAACG